MNNELLEKGPDMQDGPEKYSYKAYVDLGGIINEKDYKFALGEAQYRNRHDTHYLNQFLNPEDKLELEGLANLAQGYIRIAELNPNDPNMLIQLFIVLRKDVRPAGVKHHHDNMSDQQIIVEALRMLEDAESVEKMIKRHPQINFNYKKD